MGGIDGKGPGRAMTDGLRGQLSNLNLSGNWDLKFRGRFHGG